MLIRNMKIKDIPSVRNIAYTVYEITYANIIPRTIQENFLALVYAPIHLEQRMTQSHFYIIEIEQEIIGFSSFSHVDKEGNSELLAMYLNYENQGRKIGGMLILHAKNDIENIASITMNMEAENVNGIKFGLNNGFISERIFIDDFEGLE